MTQLQEAPQDIVETFLPTILENDAKGILSDMLAQPALAMHFMGFTEDQTLRAIRHVVGILEECYRAGHLKIAVSHEEDRLYGYAMFFVHPEPTMSRYLHKIFVFAPYRGHGLGGQLLNGVLHYSQGTSLLCRHDLVPFYERAGMEYKGNFTPPAAQQGFAFTREMYAGLAIMGTPGADGASPVFMLNDEDLQQLLVI
jgi:GNAT superfamily N-acetyltransferase